MLIKGPFFLLLSITVLRKRRKQIKYHQLSSQRGNLKWWAERETHEKNIRITVSFLSLALRTLRTLNDSLHQSSRVPSYLNSMKLFVRLDQDQSPSRVLFLTLLPPWNLYRHHLLTDLIFHVAYFGYVCIVW